MPSHRLHRQPPPPPRRGHLRGGDDGIPIRFLAQLAGAPGWLWMCCKRLECGYRWPQPIAPLIILYGRDIDPDWFRTNVRCPQCGLKGVVFSVPTWINTQIEVQPFPIQKEYRNVCGRVRLSTDYSEIKIRLKLDDKFAAPNIRPSWNVSPTQDVLIVRRDKDAGTRRPNLVRWGLLPRWEKEPKTKLATHNAVSETFRTKALFKELWEREQRCLVVVDGFYEWKPIAPKEKQPFAIARADGNPMVFAGLWDSKDWGGEVVRSATIMTCEATPEFAEMHDRFPVILEERDWPRWLGEVAADERSLLDLLRPLPNSELKIWPVDKRVGNSRNDGPELAEPINL